MCLLESAVSDRWLQSVAAELNLPATAFVWPGDGSFGLRWFSPTTELAICGHGTLASAHVLWEDGRLARDAVAHFATPAGPLRARRRGDEIELDFPADDVEPTVAPEELIRALGVPLIACGRSQRDYLVEVGSEDEVRAIAPDLALLRSVPTRGVIVTARASLPGFDIVSRFFAPSAGIGEDAVTGSAHCALGTYWQRRLGKSELRAYQASARGGSVRVRIENGRAVLSGPAVTVVRGEFGPFITRT